MNRSIPGVEEVWVLQASFTVAERNFMVSKLGLIGALNSVVTQTDVYIISDSMAILSYHNDYTNLRVQTLP